MKYKQLNQKEKDDLVLSSHIKGCTLDGKPALIGGRLNKFATVGHIDGLLAVEWSWETAQRIMNNDQKFSTK